MIDEEELARVLCCLGGFDPDEIMANDGPRWKYYVPQARAAIAYIVPKVVDDAAERIKALEAENATLAAGSCDVPGGKLGDEHGHSYCSLQKRIKVMEAENARLRNVIVDALEIIEDQLPGEFSDWEGRAARAAFKGGE